MTQHQWNTGRQYDQYGQRMIATVTEEGIQFSDLSRHIDGLIPLGAYMRGSDLDKRTIEDLVMFNYDQGNYTGNNKTLIWQGLLMSR